MVGSAHRRVDVHEAEDDERSDAERRQDVTPAGAEEIDREHRKGDADDDRAAAVRAERVLRDRRERESADREKRERAEARGEKCSTEERGEEEPGLEQVRDAEE